MEDISEAPVNQGGRPESSLSRRRRRARQNAAVHVKKTPESCITQKRLGGGCRADKFKKLFIDFVSLSKYR